MEDIIIEQIVKKDSFLKRILKKIKCKLACCCGSSCSYNEADQNEENIKNE